MMNWIAFCIVLVIGCSAVNAQRLTAYQEADDDERQETPPVQRSTAPPTPAQIRRSLDEAGAGAGLDYSPQFLFVTFGLASTSRLEFGEPFRAFRPGDTGASTGPRYRQLTDGAKRAYNVELAVHLRFRDLVNRGERSRGWIGVPTTAGLDPEDATVKAELAKRRAAFGLPRDEVDDPGQVFELCYSLIDVDMSMHFLLGESLDKGQISEGLQAQSGASLRGTLTPITLDLNWMSPAPADAKTLIYDYSLSIGPSVTAWAASDYSLRGMHWMAGYGGIVSFSVFNFASYKASEVIRTEKDGDHTDTRTRERTYARAAEFRASIYYCGFSTAAIRERSVLVEDATTEVRDAFVRIDRYGLPRQRRDRGVQLVAETWLPFSTTLGMVGRVAVISSERGAVWSASLGITLSLSDLAAAFG